MFYKITIKNYSFVQLSFEGDIHTPSEPEPFNSNLLNEQYITQNKKRYETYFTTITLKYHIVYIRVKKKLKFFKVIVLEISDFFFNLTIFSLEF